MQSNCLRSMYSPVALVFFLAMAISAYGQENPIRPNDDEADRPDSAEFSGLVAGTIRACAGGIQDDDVHTRETTLQLIKNGQPHTVQTKVSLAFSGVLYTGTGVFPPTIYNSVTGAVIEAGAEVESDDAGKVKLKILSSNLISQPTLSAYWTGVQADDHRLGNAPCNFVIAENIRLLETAPGAGTYTVAAGWEIVDDSLVEKGDEEDSTAINIYLKYRVDPNPALNTIPTNFRPVNNHEMRVRFDTNYDIDPAIARMTRRRFTEVATGNPPPAPPTTLNQVDEPIAANDLHAYVLFTNAAGDLIGEADEIIATSAEVTTHGALAYTAPRFVLGKSMGDGLYKVYVRAGRELVRVEQLGLAVENQTQLRRP